MPITLRHDAAAVVPPSNQTTRKYGQQLVLQQQQQKYAAQQAGYDRMFDAYKQQTQNQFQFGRDQFQNEMAFRKENRDNQFLLDRDKTKFEQQQQQMEAERQRQFMEDARKQSSGMIMQDIQNGEFDPATARKLQQNLVEESEALGNPQLDATQRAKVLESLRAQRATLAANRLQKPPAPTPDEEIAGLPEINGTKYQKNKNGVWEPLQPSKQQQQQQELQQQEIEAMRPKSFQDYYGENEDKFQKDLDATMQSMEKTDPKTGAVTPATQDEALAKMQKDYEFRQKALGKPQYGEPTPAGQADPGAATPAIPGTERSILEPSQAPTLPGAAQTSSGEPSSILDAPIPSQQEGLRAEYDAEMTAKGYKLITPPDGGRPYYYHAGSNTQAESPAEVQSGTPAAPSQNPWEEVAAPPTQMQATPEQMATKSKGQPTPAPITPPDFAKLSEGASESDLTELQSMKEVYNGLPPNAQQAMNVILSDSATKEQKAAANRALLQMGINLQDELSKRAVKPEYPNFAETNAVM